MPTTTPAITDYGLEAQAIERSRRLAELLQQSSLEPAGNTMSGGWAVPISPFQGLNKMAQGYVGAQGQKVADERLRALAARMRGDTAQWMAGMPQGTPATPGTPATFGQSQGGPSADLSGIDQPIIPGTPGTPAMPASKEQMLPWLMRGMNIPTAAPMAAHAAQVLMTPPSADALVRRDTSLLTHNTASANALLTQQGENDRFYRVSGNTAATEAGKNDRFNRVSGSTQANIDARPTEPPVQFMRGGKPVWGTREEALGQPPVPPASVQIHMGASQNSVPAQYANLHGEEYLATLPPGQAGIVKAIAEGRMTPQQATGRSQDRQALMQHVTQYDPGMNTTARGKTLNYFTNGKGAENATAIDTALGHIGTAKELTAALANNDIRLANSVTNRWATETGHPEANNLDLAVQAISNELMRVFRQVQASETETQDFARKFRVSNGPVVMNDALKTAGKLLSSRIDELNNMYDRGMGTQSGMPGLLSSNAVATLRALGVPVKTRATDRNSATVLKFDAQGNPIP